MHRIRKQRLYLVLALVAGSSLVVGLSTYAMRNYANFFYTVSAIQAGEAPVDKPIRAGGCVVPGSITSATDKLLTSFVITDGLASLTVTYDGLLPDIFGEGEAAVVNGRLNDEGVLVASEVLAKHDENYVPAEVADTMTDEEKYNEACKGIDYDS